jgi:energy-converting hydrogenase Eha subunit H
MRGNHQAATRELQIFELLDCSAFNKMNGILGLASAVRQQTALDESSKQYDMIFLIISKALLNRVFVGESGLKIHKNS